MEYRTLTANQQAAILRSFMQSTEADHFRLVVQREAAAKLDQGAGNLDGLDEQLAATENLWQVAADQLAKIEPPAATTIPAPAPEPDPAPATGDTSTGDETPPAPPTA